MRVTVLAVVCAALLLPPVAALVLAPALHAGPIATASTVVSRLPPDCLPDARLRPPDRVQFVVWCGVRPGKVHFEIETAPGVRLAHVPARASASGPGARGAFSCHRTPKGAACTGRSGGPLTVRGQLAVQRSQRCERIRISTERIASGGEPLGCPGVRMPRLRIDWEYFRAFRRETGIDWDLDGSRAALDRRIRSAIAGWRRGEPVARVSASMLGMPLTPFEMRRFELREELLERTVDALERWVPAHAADTYAGYTLDTSGPTIIRIGFTGDQAAQLAAFKRQVDLFEPQRVQSFLVPPKYSEKQLGEYEEQIIEPNSPLTGLVTSVGSGLDPGTIEIGTQHVAKVKRLLLTMFGTLDPFHVSFEPPGELL